MKKFVVVTVFVLLLSTIGLVDRAIKKKWVIFPDKRQRLALYCHPDDELLGKKMAVYYGLKSGEVKPLKHCLGYDSFDPGYGNFQLNNLFFRIPRDFLSGYGDADGPTSNVHMAFSFPEMLPEKLADKEKKLVRVVIRRTFKKKACEEKACLSLKEYFYFQNFFSTRLKDRESSMDKIRIYFDEVKQSKSDFGLFKIKTKEGYMYYSGDIMSPVYWLNCNNALCNSQYWENDSILVNYVFDKDFFLINQHEIRSAVRSKISEFKVNWKDRS